MNGCYDIWDDCLHPSLHEFAQCQLLERDPQFWVISATSMCRMQESVSIPRVCSPVLYRVTPKWGILVEASAGATLECRALCIPVSLRPADLPAASSSQAIWSWGNFRECQEAGFKSSVPPVQTRHHRGCPAKNFKLSFVYYLWSCVKDSLSLGLCATWFSSALWNWATVTTWLQPSTCAL